MEEKTQFSSYPKEGEPWDVVIIGSGPAGLTAAIYTTRGAASTLILGGEKWGGQLMLTTTVDNYPALPGIQGPDLMRKLRDHSTLFGGEFVEKNVERVDLNKTPYELHAGGKKYLAKSIIIATGADTKWLGVPGESKLLGRGISSCAPCDAPFFKGKKVAVVGGGDSAMEEASVLSKYATQVLLIHRRDEFRASAAMQIKVFNNPKIEVFHCSEVLEVKGNQVLEKLKMKTWKQSKYFEQLKHKIEQHSSGVDSEDGEFVYWTLPIQGLFVAVGHFPASEVFKGPIELDEKGYIVVHDHTKTNVLGVFVAGDVHDYHYKQAVTAAGFGCMAAMNALKHLEEIQSLT